MLNLTAATHIASSHRLPDKSRFTWDVNMDVNVNGDVNVSVGNQRVQSAWRQMIYDNKLKVFQACVVTVNTRNALTTFIHSKHESWQRLLKPT